MATTPSSRSALLPLRASTAIVRVVDAYVERCRLTTAEREILIAVTIDGVPPRNIGLAFLRSETTTKTHVRNLIRKTNHRSFAELALAVLRDALVGAAGNERARTSEAAREEKTNVGEGSSECPSRAVAEIRRPAARSSGFEEVVRRAMEKRSRSA